MSTAVLIMYTRNTIHVNVWIDKLDAFHCLDHIVPMAMHMLDRFNYHHWPISQ